MEANVVIGKKIKMIENKDEIDFYYLYKDFINKVILSLASTLLEKLLLRKQG